MLNHDPELPAGFQDADIEMHALTQAAIQAANRRKHGICDHGWRQGPPGTAHKPTTIWTCHDCGATFATEAEMDADAAATK
jgi:ribosomal protein L37AE/L43A